MKKFYTVKKRDGATIRVTAIRDCKVLGRTYWDLYLVNGVFNTSTHLTRVDCENLIGEAIRVNIGDVGSIQVVSSH